MNDTIGGRPKTPWHLWVIGVVATIWNAGGVASYLATETGNLEQMGMTAEQIAYFSSFPAWAVAFWALGVWGCFLGSIALLLRRKWATWLYGISIVGLLGTTFYERTVADIPASMQTHGQLWFAAAIWVITIFLLIYSSRMTRAGILR